MKFNDDDLDDDGAKLAALGIKHNDIVDVDTGMLIKVKTPGGLTIPLKVKPDQKVESVMQTLEEKTGIKVDEQCLKKNDETDITEDPSKTLEGYNINHGETLDLSYKIAKVSKPMQITIKDWNGQTFVLDVVSDESITDVKQKIEDKAGIPKAHQFLMFGGKNIKEIDGGMSKTLEDYNIKHESIVNLERMKIFIKKSDGKFSLNVDPTNTIQDIKAMIQKREGLKPDEQVLTFGDVPLDADLKTLLEYAIQHKSTLNLDRTGGDNDDGGPEYDVKMTGWQSSFGFVSKDKQERVGKRKKKKPGMYYWDNIFLGDSCFPLVLFSDGTSSRPVYRWTV